jgi:hypothetical protein
MIETGARLWAVPELLARGVPLDGILFQRKKAAETPGDGQLPITSAAFLSVFSPDIPVAVADSAETVETLYVPEIGISVTPERFVGTREHWTFFRDRAGRVKPHPDPADIYVSRTRDGARGGFLFEADIEAVMAAAGYRIFHPQQHSISVQIATYRSARRLVSIDGSALHPRRRHWRRRPASPSWPGASFSPGPLPTSCIQPPDAGSRWSMSGKPSTISQARWPPRTSLRR